MKLRLCFLSVLMWFMGVYAQTTQQINILAIRVEFVEDSLDLTSGNGKFDLSVNDSLTENQMDPPPHNRYYFEDHLLFLKNYYENISRGKLEINYQCFPQQIDAAYQLPHQMAYYSPFTNIDDVNKGLAELFRDSWNAAAEDPAIDIQQYDAFIIFHAGVGQDIQIDLDETPQDISSIYITPEFLQTHLGVEYIELPNGAQISEGAILPETERQLDLDLAMNGMVVAQFASYLGLKDLFNSKTRLTAVGKFDLMDVGLFNMNGLVPSIPMAWHRYQMGWDNVETINYIQDSLLTIGGYDKKIVPRIYKFPITNDEYFLVEKREGEGVIIDSLLISEIEKTESPVNYKQILKKYYSGTATFSERGVLTSLLNYDLSQPAHGILIWHIDEQRINKQLADGNGINDDESHRGIDLEEADGSQDIGQTFGFLSAGSGSENGYLLDMFYKSNNAPIYKKNENSFGVNTIPSSSSYYAHAVSGLQLSDFSEPADIMSFRANYELFEPGTPFETQLSPIRSLHSFTKGSSIIAVVSDSSVFSVVNLMTQQFSANEVPLQSGEQIKSVISFPQDNDTLVMLTNQRLLEMVLSETDADINNLNLGNQFSGIKSSWMGKFAYLMDDQSIGKYDFLRRQFISQTAFTATIRDFVVFSSEVQDYLAVLTDDSLLILDQNLEKRNDYSLAMDGDALYTRLHILESDSIYNIILESPEQLSLLPLAVEGLDQGFGKMGILYTSESPVHDVKCFQWKSNGYIIPVIGVLDNSLKILNLSGAIIENFPVSLNNTRFPGKFAEIFGAFNSPADTGVYMVGVLTHSFTGKDSLSSTTINFYNQSGKPEFSYFLPLGSETLKPTIHSPVNDNMILVFNSDQTKLAAIPIQLQAISLNHYINKVSTGNSFVRLGKVLQTENAITGNLLPEKLTYNWPNPVTGAITHIRFFVQKDANISIEVFDEVGNRIWETNTTAVGNLSSEVIMSVENLSSGVYFAKITADAADGSGSETRIIKIAVLK